MKKRILGIAVVLIMALTAFGVLAACGGGKTTSYTVTFDLQGGSGSIAAQTVNSGDKATKPATNPTKTSFEFVGWSEFRGSYSAYDFNKAINKDTTVYAFWKIPGEELITITLDLNGGAGAATSVKIVKGSNLGSVEAPTLSGKVFVGWTTEKNNAETLISLDNTFDEADTLYAYWINATDTKGQLIAAFNKTANNITGVHGVFENVITNDEEEVKSTEEVKLLIKGTSTTGYYEKTTKEDGSYYLTVAINNKLFELYEDKKEETKEYSRSHDVPIGEIAPDASSFIESISAMGISIMDEEITATVSNGVYTVTKTMGSGEDTETETSKITVKNGFVTEIKDEENEANVTKLYTNANPFVIAEPSLPTGETWKNYYTLKIIFPTGTTKSGETTITSYNMNKFEFKAQQLDDIKSNYRVVGYYKDAGFTQEITADLTLTASISIYVKTELITGARGEVLVALDRLFAENKFEVKITSDDVFVGIEVFGRYMKYGYSRFGIMHTYYENYEYDSETTYDKIWSDHIEWKSYALQGEDKTTLGHAISGDIQHLLRNSIGEAQNTDNTVTVEGGVYNIKDVIYIKVESGKITKLEFYDEVYDFNYGATQIPTMPATGWDA